MRTFSLSIAAGLFLGLGSAYAGDMAEVGVEAVEIPLPPPRPADLGQAAQAKPRGEPKVASAANPRPKVIWLSMGSGF